jgi:hypothetical protein
MKRRTLALGLALTLTMALGETASAASADLLPDIHPDVAFALNSEPGGVVVDFYTAEWPESGMRLEVPGLLRASVGSCATGYICAYSLGGQGGTKLSWPTCGTKSTATISTVGSIANARSSGTLSAFQGSTVRASAAAGSYVNVAATYRTLITSVSC